MLKAWILWGHHKPDKSGHKTSWEIVVEAREAGTLPSIADLDRSAIYEWPRGSSGSAGSAAPPAAVVVVASAAASSSASTAALPKAKRRRANVDSL